MSREAWIIDAVRTPRGTGKPGKGGLAHLHPQRLGAAVLTALQSRNDIKTEEVDDVLWGCSAQVGKQGTCIGRMSVLDAGWSPLASGMTLDRFCGSGITVTNLAAASIMSGMEDRGAPKVRPRNSGGFWAIQALVGISGFFVFLGSWVILSKLIQGISN